MTARDRGSEESDGLGRIDITGGTPRDFAMGVWEIAISPRQVLSLFGAKQSHFSVRSTGKMSAEMRKHPGRSAQNMAMFTSVQTRVLAHFG